jgi:hypothetical protein
MMANNNTLPKHKSLTRTNMEEAVDLPYSGVYIIAYMGKIVYVGKSGYNVSERLTNHVLNRHKEPLGGWLYNMRFDWINIRLEVLESPDDVNETYWLQETENALIRKLKPLFNEKLQP